MNVILKGESLTRKCWLDGRPLRPEKSQKAFNHSPDGFNWGYGGSGPAQLALAVLLQLTDQATAIARHQDLKWDVISKLPAGQDFEIEFDIAPYLSQRRQADLFDEGIQP
jgi:hypothetical protein